MSTFARNMIWGSALAGALAVLWFAFPQAPPVQAAHSTATQCSSERSGLKCPSGFYFCGSGVGTSSCKAAVEVDQIAGTCPGGKVFTGCGTCTCACPSGTVECNSQCVVSQAGGECTINGEAGVKNACGTCVQNAPTPVFFTPSVPQATTSTRTPIQVNKQAAGDILTLQSNGATVLNTNATGLQLGSPALGLAAGQNLLYGLGKYSVLNATSALLHLQTVSDAGAYLTRLLVDRDGNVRVGGALMLEPIVVGGVPQSGRISQTAQDVSLTTGSGKGIHVLRYNGIDDEGTLALDGSLVVGADRASNLARLRVLGKVGETADTSFTVTTEGGVSIELDTNDSTDGKDESAAFNITNRSKGLFNVREPSADNPVVMLTNGDATIVGKLSAIGGVSAPQLCIGTDCRTSWTSVSGSNVQLQSATPGTAQIGHFSVSGTGKMSALDVNGTAKVTTLDVAGSIQAGIGNVTIVDGSGKIPALTSTYFANLDGAALTNLNGAAVSGANITNLNASNIASGTLNASRLPTTITQTTTFANPVTISHTNPYLQLTETDATAAERVQAIIGRDGSVLVQANNGSTWQTSAQLWPDKQYFPGKVGIGTSNPGLALSVVGDSGVTGERQWTYAKGDGSVIPLARVKKHIVGSDGSSGGRLLLETATNNAGGWNDQQVVLDNSGKVGIGLNGVSSVPLAMLYVRDRDNNADADIGQFVAQNQTQGIGIGYNRIAAVGSNTNQDINLVPKGSGNVSIDGGLTAFNVGFSSGDVLGRWTAAGGEPVLAGRREVQMECSPSSSSKTCSKLCDTGWHSFGGGCDVGGSSARVSKPYTSGSRTGWWCEAKDYNTRISAYAVCAKLAD
ncbi:hypothetical protein HY480_00510 [Candidatus Uhrbacteria bacterium]|nr:hypothetical protein [Candidatus Uhrbacteria bacterium]